GLVDVEAIDADAQREPAGERLAAIGGRHRLGAFETAFDGKALKLRLFARWRPARGDIDLVLLAQRHPSLFASKGAGLARFEPLRQAKLDVVTAEQRARVDRLHR